MNELLKSATEALRLRFGAACSIDECTPLPGQASSRSYYRLTCSGGEAPASTVLMQLPADPFASDEAAGAETVAELPFCTMLKYLDGLGLPVPLLYHDGAAEGFVLLEDLGDATALAELQARGPGSIEGIYREAIDLLAKFQAATRPAAGSAAYPEVICYSRRFDYDLLRWELDHFREWLLLDYAGGRPTPDEDRQIEAAFDEIAARLVNSPYRLAHRDFQSTNLMRRERELVLIDFQDALMAPPVYDLVSLLRDSYVVIPPPLLEGLKTYYYEQCSKVVPLGSREDFQALFALQTAQRKLKDAGRFVFIDRRKGNPTFLGFIDDSLAYVARAFDELPEYSRLRDLLSRWVPQLR